MNSRQENLLVKIIEEHIKTASPVGSQFLVENGGFAVSSATIRNEMAALEEAGLIRQPHTSAGRVPTNKGYRFYLQELLRQGQPVLKSKDQQLLEQVHKQHKGEAKEIQLKALAKAVAQAAQAGVFLGINERNYYYTGLTYLLAQPEFMAAERACNLARSLDDLDNYFAGLFNKVNELKVYLGDIGPLPADCSLLLAPLKVWEKPTLFGILGPLRMDYRRNIALLNQLKLII